MRAAWALLLLFVILVTTVPCAGKEPSWKQREFDAPASQVFDLALKSVQQRYELRTSDAKTMKVSFHVPVEMHSWPFDIVLTVVPLGEKRCRVETVSKRSGGGKLVFYASPKKALAKVFGDIEFGLKAGGPGKSEI